MRRCLIDMATIISNENWFVIHTTAGKEHLLMAQVRKYVPADLYEACFTPLRTERRKYKDEYKDVQMSLFPGYVFLISSRMEEIYLIFRNKHQYLNALRDEKTFLQISKSEADFLIHLLEPNEKARGNDNGLQYGNVRISTGTITNGSLKIIDGPMKGLEPYVTKIDRHKMKAELEMELFQKTQKFTMGLVIKLKE